MLGYHIEVRAVHDKALRDKDIFIHRQTTAQTSRSTTIELNEAENQLSIPTNFWKIERYYCLWKMRPF